MANNELENMKRLHKIEIVHIAERPISTEPYKLIVEIHYEIRAADEAAMYAEMVSADVSRLEVGGKKYEDWSLTERHRWAEKMAKRDARARYGKKNQ